jgi:hypothetical protein
MVQLEGKPVHWIFCSAAKKPIGLHGWYSASTDTTKLEPGPNIGVACGKINNIVIVDIDPRNGGAETFAAELGWLPATRRHRTRGGGWHLVFRYPPQGIRNFSGRAGRLPGIDILSDGKGALWPPSPGYEVIDNRLMVECPARLVELLVAFGREDKGASLSREGDAPVSSGGVQLTRSVGQRTRYILDVVMNARAGDGRNARLYWAACRFAELVAEGLVRREAAETMLLSVAKYNGHVAKRGLAQTKATIRSGLNHQIAEKDAPLSCGLEERRDEQG